MKVVLTNTAHVKSNRISLTRRGGGRRRAPSPRDRDRVGHRRELVAGEEAGSVEPVVRFERHPEEASVRLHFQVFYLAAVARQFSIHSHEIRNLCDAE